jgi:hypothetical protein
MYIDRGTERFLTYVTNTGQELLSDVAIFTDETSEEKKGEVEESNRPANAEYVAINYRIVGDNTLVCKSIEKYNGFNEGNRLYYPASIKTGNVVGFIFYVPKSRDIPAPFTLSG